MFNFKKKIVDPVVREALTSIDAASKLESASGKVEQLLAARDTFVQKFSDERITQTNRGAMALIGMIVGYGAVFLPTLAAGATAFVLSAPVVAGIGLAAVSLGAFFKTMSNRELLSTDEKTVTSVADVKLAEVLDKEPQEAVKSPRLIAKLKEAFSTAVTPTAEEQLRARVAVAAPAAPAA